MKVLVFQFSLLILHHADDDIILLGDFVRAAKVCSKFCARDSKLWEDWIFVFEEKKQLQVSKIFDFFLYIKMCKNSFFFFRP